MASSFMVVLEDFNEELDAIRALIEASSDPRLARPRARIAGANAAALLLAATFEEFVREMARTYAKAAVEAAQTYNNLPPRLASTAWKRTMENLARIQLNPRNTVFSRESIFSDAFTKFSTVYEFCRGDLSQDVFTDLVHNENNMRPAELNSLFKMSGLSNVCFLASGERPLLDELGIEEHQRNHDKLLERLEDFFERRNQVAHSLNAVRSDSPMTITNDIALLRAFGSSLCSALERCAPHMQPASGIV